ncbi:MAG: NAD(P)-dependent oxidoreductase [Actinobacteria bacterium]|nr:NAD(P)-dependent oxidoreductase [Actinomycetota bacterium]
MNDSRSRVGFIGLGIMGSRMAANLARAGHELTVWNRTVEKAEAWVAEHGGIVAESPAAVGAASDVVISMVVDGAQVEQVLTGAGGVIEGAASDCLCVDMSTIAPGDTRRIGARLAEAGVRMLDAPVTGSSPRAEAGTLTIMAGGAPEDFALAEPLLRVMGDLVVHVGELGQGEVLKLINNAVAAVNATAVGEGMLLADAAGIDLKDFQRVLASGSAGSAMVDLKAKPMREHDYTPLFKLDHMLKDVRLCLEEAQAVGSPFESAGHAREVLAAAAGRGFGEQDFAALIEALEGYAGRRL